MNLLDLARAAGPLLWVLLALSIYVVYLTVMRVLALNRLGQDAGTLIERARAVTAESAMKWGQLEPRRGQYDWTSSDRLVEFAGANGQSVYGHTLVWHTDLPDWLPQDGSPEELRELLREHITTVVSRYRGKVWAWDVVNEVLADDGSMRDTVWREKAHSYPSPRRTRTRNTGS